MRSKILWTLLTLGFLGMSIAGVVLISLELESNDLAVIVRGVGSFVIGMLTSKALFAVWAS